MWKLVKITPIPKEESSTDIENHRLISLLPVPSKIIESIINTKEPITDAKEKFKLESSSKEISHALLMLPSNLIV